MFQRTPTAHPDLAQIAENENREPLTTRELVRAVARLATFKVPLKEIGERLGLDPSRVTRIRALADLPPELEPALDTMGIDPLYELLQHHKRNPDPVLELLAREPAPPRAAVRALAEPKPRPSEHEPAELALAPAQVGRSPEPAARSTVEDKPTPASVRVAVRVQHGDYGEGRVVASTTVLPDRLPILFEGQSETIQTALVELSIVAVG